MSRVSKKTRQFHFQSFRTNFPYSDSPLSQAKNCHIKQIRLTNLNVSKRSWRLGVCTTQHISSTLKVAWAAGHNWCRCADWLSSSTSTYTDLVSAPLPCSESCFNKSKQRTRRSFGCCCLINATQRVIMDHDYAFVTFLLSCACLISPASLF